MFLHKKKNDPEFCNVFYPLSYWTEQKILLQPTTEFKHKFDLQS